MDSDFAEGLQHHIRLGGGDAAIVDGRTNHLVSYTELAQLMGRTRKFLHEKSIGPGDVVVSLLPNSIEALVLFLGAASAEIDYAPISSDAAEREVLTWLQLTRPKLCLVAAGAVGRVIDAVLGIGISVATIELDGTFSDLPAEHENDWSSHAGRLYLTTSGTTGEPKAMVFSVDRLWASASTFISLHPAIGAQPRFLNLLPMSYLGGLFNLGIIPLCAGGSTVISEPFSGRTFLSFWQTVERFDINVLWMVPTIVRGLLQLAERASRSDNHARSRNIRLCFLGTAPIAADTKRKFEETFSVSLLENYALSETTFLTSETLERDLDGRERSCGQPLPLVELRLDPIAGDDIEGTSSDLGEIVVRTPFFWLGYLGKDGRVERPLTADGFLRTGDIGRMTRNNGLLIEGRIRDFIKRGGYFVGLREVEILTEQHSAVVEAAAVGIPHSFYGESLCVFVRLKEGIAGDAILPDIEEWLRANLVKHKWPDKVVSIENFPKTASGKVRKQVLLGALKGVDA